MSGYRKYLPTCYSLVGSLSLPVELRFPGVKEELKSGCTKKDKGWRRHKGQQGESEY